MSRVGDFGRNVACYFGVGEGAESTRDQPAPEVNLLVVCLRVVIVLTLARLLQHVLGLGDGFLVGLAVVLAVAFVAALIERLVRWWLARRRRSWPA